MLGIIALTKRLKEFPALYRRSTVSPMSHAAVTLTRIRDQLAISSI
jgi:hypothetical protein